MAASEGKLAEVETYYAKNEFGRDTVRSLALHQKKDEYQELTTFMGVANINNPLFDESNQWSAAYLKKALESYRDKLKAITFLDHRGQERVLPRSSSRRSWTTASRFPTVRTTTNPCLGKVPRFITCPWLPPCP